MNLNPPSSVRKAIYVITALSAPIMAYLNITGVIGPNEIALWSGIVTAVNVMAGLNVAKNN